MDKVARTLTSALVQDLLGLQIQLLAEYVLTRPLFSLRNM